MSFTNSTGLYVEGFYSDYGMGYRSTFNSPAELLMPAPFTYSDIETNVSFWEVVVEENIMDYDTLYRRDIDKDLEADAWGSITTDYGTFDVLRVHETGISTDSVFGYIGETTFFTMEVERDTINKYYFWAKDVRQPVLTIHCDYENNIERIDFLMGVIYSDSKIESINDPFFYPNPANNVIHIPNCDTETIIYSSNGQIVKRCIGSSTINISNLPSGLYLIKNNQNTEKLIKK